MRSSSGSYSGGRSTSLHQTLARDRDCGKSKSFAPFPSITKIKVFFFFFFYNTSIPAVCVLFRIHREPELGADSCPLFYTSEYRQNLPAVANNTWSVTAQGRKRRALVPVAFRFLSFVGAGTAVSKAVIVHPKYNIRALKHRNVSEFYDYDVALIQVDTSIPLSWKARSEG